MPCSQSVSASAIGRAGIEMDQAGDVPVGGLGEIVVEQLVARDRTRSPLGPASENGGDSHG